MERNSYRLIFEANNTSKALSLDFRTDDQGNRFIEPRPISNEELAQIWIFDPDFNLFSSLYDPNIVLYDSNLEADDNPIFGINKKGNQNEFFNFENGSIIGYNNIKKLTYIPSENNPFRLKRQLPENHRFRLEIANISNFIIESPPYNIPFIISFYYGIEEYCICYDKELKTFSSIPLDLNNLNIYFYYSSKYNFKIFSASIKNLMFFGGSQLILSSVFNKNNSKNWKFDKRNILYDNLYLTYLPNSNSFELLPNDLNKLQSFLIIPKFEKNPNLIHINDLVPIEEEEEEEEEEDEYSITNYSATQSDSYDDSSISGGESPLLLF